MRGEGGTQSGLVFILLLAPFSLPVKALKMGPSQFVELLQLLGQLGAELRQTWPLLFLFFLSWVMTMIGPGADGTIVALSADAVVTPPILGAAAGGVRTLQRVGNGGGGFCD